MTVKLLTMALTLSLAALAVGCSPDCVAVCEETAGCTDGPKPDCAENCEKAEKIDELANCEDQHADFLRCVEDQEDVCKTGAQCEQRAKDYLDCVAGYCINHAADCQ
jgi:hypothetical protein